MIDSEKPKARVRKEQVKETAREAAMPIIQAAMETAAKAAARKAAQKHEAPKSPKAEVSESEPKQEKKQEAAPKEKEKPLKIAVIRVRGEVGVDHKIEDTLTMLHLTKKNRCTIIPNAKSYIGMLNKIKDYCTFGEIDDKTVAMLLEKRGRLKGDSPLTQDYLKEKLKVDFNQFASIFMQDKMGLKDIPGLKHFFKLHPPIGGFEREGIKKPYSIGGALGYRGPEINKLIRRMV